MVQKPLATAFPALHRGIATKSGSLGCLGARVGVVILGHSSFRILGLEVVPETSSCDSFQ